MGDLRFAFVGRVSTEDNQEPEASRARQITQAKRILPPGAEIVAGFFDIDVSRSVPWARRPQTGLLLDELRSPDRRWNAIVAGEFARAFGAPIQYSTVYPLLEHFGVELWLPEVGGRVDFGSATTEMLLGMLGGTSKQERTLVRSRVRDGMAELAREGGRHLGGRPPYGYQLVDAGPHPNAKKRALGQRLRRLEPDPVTAPIVRRIFTMFVNGQGYKQIANALTADDMPSPSAHDRRRNPHRDPRGWAYSAVRAILKNEKYLGKAIWGKQARTERLYDLDDVAAGYIVRQEWTDHAVWVYGPDADHPPLIDQNLWDAAQARITIRSHQGPASTRSPRPTTTPYVLRGLIHCGICERKMVGATSRGTHRYRCLATKSRALPAYLADHPKSLYVREDAIVSAVDRWLPELADPEWLAATQEPDRLIEVQYDNLRRRLREIDKALGSLVDAIEAGADPMAIQPRIALRRAEREQVALQLANLQAPNRLTGEQIRKLLDELGGLTSVLGDATPAEKSRIYQALGVHLLYLPDQQAVLATASLSGVLKSVGGGT